MSKFYVLTTEGPFTIEADTFERWDREFYAFCVNNRRTVLRERVGVFGGVRSSENVERVDSRWRALVPASSVIIISMQPPASAIEARSDATGTGAAEGESATGEAGDAQKANRS